MAKRKVRDQVGQPVSASCLAWLKP
jgi:hypothetical protein